METIKRRLELLKLEGLGFNQPDIVKQLTEEFKVSERVIYYDFERRAQWQPKLQDLKDTDKLLYKIANRYEQIYRHASLIYLTGSNENAQLGALSVMTRANEKLAEAAVIPDLIARLTRMEEAAKKRGFGH